MKTRVEFSKMPVMETVKADDIVKDLIEGNQRFVEGNPRNHSVSEETRHDLFQGQHPVVTVLTCSDSRVSPEIIFDEGLGRLFVIRNAGNSVNQDVLAAMEFSCGALGTPVLVIMGHQNCGALVAAIAGGEHPKNLAAMLETLGPVESGTTIEKLVPEHVSRMAHRVTEESPLLKDLVEGGRLRIVEAVYYMDSGRVEWLNS